MDLTACLQYKGAGFQSRFNRLKTFKTDPSKLQLWIE